MIDQDGSPRHCPSCVPFFLRSAHQPAPTSKTRPGKPVKEDPISYVRQKRLDAVLTLNPRSWLAGLDPCRTHPKRLLQQLVQRVGKCTPVRLAENCRPTRIDARAAQLLHHVSHRQPFADAVGGVVRAARSVPAPPLRRASLARGISAVTTRSPVNACSTMQLQF